MSKLVKELDAFISDLEEDSFGESNSPVEMPQMKVINSLHSSDSETQSLIDRIRKNPRAPLAELKAKQSTLKQSGKNRIIAKIISALSGNSQKEKAVDTTSENGLATFSSTSTHLEGQGIYLDEYDGWDSLKITRSSKTETFIALAEYIIVIEEMNKVREIAETQFLDLFENFKVDRSKIDFLIEANAQVSKRSYNYNKFENPSIIFKIDAELTQGIVSEGMTSERIVTSIAEYVHELTHAFIEPVLMNIGQYREALTTQKSYSVLESLREAFPILATYTVLLRLRNMSRNGSPELINQFDDQLKLVMKQYSELDVMDAGYKIAKKLSKISNDALMEWVRTVDFLSLAKIDISSEQGLAIQNDPIGMTPRIKI